MSGALLVVVAHPDDELLGTAGVIVRAREEGRQVTVAVLTNGEAGRGRENGLRRNAESIAGLAQLGVRWSCDPEETQVFFLGYEDGGIASPRRITRAATYALDADGGEEGDFRFLVSGRHSRLRRRDLARDLDELLERAAAEHVYTHVPFDGHPDHAATARYVTAALARRGAATLVHGTLMHPPGAAECFELSASRWPNPATDGDARARFRPDDDVEPPPHPACATAPVGRRWGPSGPPDELVEVPPAMRTGDEERNLKWRAISEHRSQLELGPVSAGYLRAFVKRREFFWTWRAP